MAKTEVIADDTIRKLPKIGQPDTQGRLATLAINLARESVTIQGTYTGYGFSNLDRSERLYLFGDCNASAWDGQKRLNETQGIIDTRTSDTCRIPASMTLLSASVNEDGVWVLTKPFSIMPPTDPTTGQPPVNQLTGQPAQPVPLTLYEPIDDAVVDSVPASHRVCIDTETTVAYFQSLWDIKRRECRFDDTVLQMVHLKQIQGWPMGVFVWDAPNQRPCYRLLPPQQWFPDPTCERIEDMRYVRVDWVVDAELAKRLYPQAAAAIDAAASKTVFYATGGTGYSSVYTSVRYETPQVTLTMVWLRNQEIEMSEVEALDSGLVHSVEIDLEVQPEGPEADTEGVQDETDEDGAEPQGDQTGDAAEPESPQVKKSSRIGLRNAITGEEVTPQKDEDGNTVHHPNFPKKSVTRFWITIRDKTVPGTDCVCPDWDIAVFKDTNIPISFRPFGIPETERLQSPQSSLNQVHTAEVAHAGRFKGPLTIVDKGAIDKLPQDFINGFTKPDTVYVIEKIDPAAPLDSVIKVIDPPPIPPALTTMFEQLENSLDKVAGRPSVKQGTPPPGVHSGVAIAQLQAESSASSDVKTLGTEYAIYRMGMLGLWGIVHWLSITEMLACNRRYPRQVVERYIVPYARRIKWDMEVAVANGGGQVQSQKKAQIRADFVSVNPATGQPLIDAETARDALDYNSDEIDRRLKQEAKEKAQQQMEMQPPPQAIPQAPQAAAPIPPQVPQ